MATLIYVHGLDSSANSTKGTLLDAYCQHNKAEFASDLQVLRPDLNQPPQQVIAQLSKLIVHPEQTVLIGSSLGGYFSTLLANQTGCRAILLNPSTRPHLTLQRFFNTTSNINVSDEHIDTGTDEDMGTNADTSTGTSIDTSKTAQSGYVTSGGWSMTKQDLQWFSEHALQSIAQPQHIKVLLKQGDELLDPKISAAFYQKCGVSVCVQEGGDHQMTDFETQLPMVLDWAKQLLSTQ